MNEIVFLNDLTLLRRCRFSLSLEYCRYGRPRAGGGGGREKKEGLNERKKRREETVQREDDEGGRGGREGEGERE